MHATRESWRLAWPLILSNLSVPMLGVVDTAVVGHLDCAPLSRRRGAGCPGRERALLAVRLPAHGHHRADRPGLRCGEHRRGARRRGPGDAAGPGPGPLRHSGRPAGHPPQRTVVRAATRGRGGVRALSGDPPVRSPGGAGQHGALRLAARAAGFAAAAAPDAPDQRHQCRARDRARVRPGAGDPGRGHGDRRGGVCRIRDRPADRARHLAQPGRLAGLGCDHGGSAISPPARGQPRPVPAQHAPGGGFPRLRRHRAHARARSCSPPMRC